jgi:hypothetical protein
MDGAHDRQVLEQLQQAALFRGGAVMQLRGVNLRCQVEQDSHFVVKLCDELVFCEDHELSPDL